MNDASIDDILDADTYRRLQAGDHQCFAEVVCPFEPRLRAVAARLLGHLEEAEDVAHEALVNAYRQRAQFQPERALYPWLRSITKNLALNRLRSRERQRARRGDLLRTQLAYQQQDDAGEAAAESLDALRACLDTLPAAQRQLLAQRYGQGQSVQELAAAAGLRANGLSMRLLRLRELLRRCIEDRLGLEQ